MKQLGYVVQHLESLKHSAHVSTELLELCDWSEEEADVLIDNVKSTIEDIHDEITRGKIPVSNFISELNDRLSGFANNEQIVTIKKLLHIEVAAAKLEQEAVNGNMDVF